MGSQWKISITTTTTKIGLVFLGKISRFLGWARELKLFVFFMYMNIATEPIHVPFLIHINRPIDAITIIFQWVYCIQCYLIDTCIGIVH